MMGEGDFSGSVLYVQTPVGSEGGRGHHCTVAMVDRGFEY